MKHYPSAYEDMWSIYLTFVCLQQYIFRILGTYDPELSKKQVSLRGKTKRSSIW